MTEDIYIPQAVKNIFIVSKLLSKVSTMGDTLDKITLKKNSVNIVLDTRKGENESTIFYLKLKRYAPEGTKPQEANINLPEEEKYGNEEKEYWRKKLGLPI